MTQTRYYSCAAFAFLLLLLLAGSLVIQTAGYAFDLALAPYSLYIAFLPALLITYGYCFPLTKSHVKAAVLMSVLLAVLGLISRRMLDFSADGLGYQQASVEAIMNGWNPFGPDAIMLWQQLYPSGIWAIEASLSYLYGSVEAAKMLHVWLICIAIPLLLFGLARYKGRLGGQQIVLVVLSVFSPTLLSQLLTHYVDADAYLAGLIFVGGMLFYGHSRRFNIVSMVIMVASLCIVINSKLSGVYHGVMLCAGAVTFLWVRTCRIPWKAATVLAAAGVFAIVALGYRPYVTSFIHYGPSLFPPDKIAYGPQPLPRPHYFLSNSNTEAFSATQRPSSFDDIPPAGRFFYSLFSTDGGGPHTPAVLKWPWTLTASEVKFAGDPDPRTGGYGPLFALGFVLSLAVFVYAVISRLEIDKALVALAIVCLAFSMIFPQSWWARYVPFAYFVPFLLLLSIGAYGRKACVTISAVIVIFSLNSEISAGASWVLYYKSERHFAEVVGQLKEKPEGSVYLVPPVLNYKRYNGAYMPLQRRLSEAGIPSVIHGDAVCMHMAEMYSEFAICY